MDPSQQVVFRSSGVADNRQAFGPYVIEPLLTVAEESAGTVYRVQVEAHQHTSTSYHTVAEEFYYPVVGKGEGGGPSSLLPNGLIYFEDRAVTFPIPAPVIGPVGDALGKTAKLDVKEKVSTVMQTKGALRCLSVSALVSSLSEKIDEVLKSLNDFPFFGIVCGALIPLLQVQRVPLGISLGLVSGVAKGPLCPQLGWWRYPLSCALVDTRRVSSIECPSGSSCMLSF